MEKKIIFGSFRSGKEKKQENAPKLFSRGRLDASNHFSFLEQGVDVGCFETRKSSLRREFTKTSVFALFSSPLWVDKLFRQINFVIKFLLVASHITQPTSMAYQCRE